MRREISIALFIGLLAFFVGVIGVELGVGEVLNDWLTR